MKAKVIGVCGLARSGKDTIYNLCNPVISSMGKSCKRLAFADELKQESDEFLIKNIGISAFTEDSREKELIRPFLVTYGTHLRRRLNKECWIEKVDEKLKETKEDFVFITDVRYENEIEWVHNLGGISIHVEREGIEAPNEEEAKNDPILKNNSLLNVKWKTLKDENPSLVNTNISEIITLITNGQ